jgi:hypothetical protein
MGGIIMSTFTKVIGVALDSITKVLSVSVENAEKVLGVGPSGGGGEVAGTFLEEEKGHSPHFNDTNSAKLAGIGFDLNTDGIIAYSGGEPVNQEFTISFWANLNSSGQAANNLGLMGADAETIGGVNRKFRVDLGGGSALTSATMSARIGSTIIFNHNNVSLNLAGNWSHFAFVAESDGSNLKFKTYVNGNQLPGVGTFSLGTKIMPPSSNDKLRIGGGGQQNKSVKGLFDSIQIGDGVALTASQVSAIAGQSDRQMSIGTAAGL